MCQLSFNADSGPFFLCEAARKPQGVILLKGMDQNEKEGLRHKRNRLVNLENEIARHEELLKSARSRAESWQGADESVMKVLRQFFSELSEAFPEKNIKFNDNNSIDGLLAQLSSAYSKVQDAISVLSSSLGEAPPPPDTQPSENPLEVAQLQAVDKRRVFVVHGRNLSAKDAMFTFLRAIGLDPIEWEEAVQMTGAASPYMGSVLDTAFSNAQAAVVLLTGDDVARLGQQFVETHDPADDKQLTPQARPNVLFEMGMAFGKYPARTVIVQFGHTRPFSDVAGRNTIHFRDNPQSRKKLSDRLTTAKCLVRTDGRTDWLTAGDFSSAFEAPIHAPTFDPLALEPPTTGLTPIPRELFDLQEANNELRKRSFSAEQSLSIIKQELEEARTQLATPKLVISIIEFRAAEEKYYDTDSVFARMGSPPNTRILIRVNLRIINEHRQPTNVQSVGLAIRGAPDSRVEHSGIPLQFPDALRAPIHFALPIECVIVFRVDQADAQAVVKSYLAVVMTDGTGAQLESDRRQIARVYPEPLDHPQKAAPTPEFWQWIGKIEDATEECEMLLRDLSHLEYKWDADGTKLLHPLADHTMPSPGEPLSFLQRELLGFRFRYRNYLSRLSVLVADHFTSVMIERDFPANMNTHELKEIMRLHIDTLRTFAEKYVRDQTGA
jgi:predicted nucleotide-binding protein